MQLEFPRLTIAAVVALNERPQLDAAAAGSFAVVHRPSLPDAAKAVRENPVDAIVFSVEQCRGPDAAHLDELIRRFPDIPTFALVTRTDPDNSEALLRLGASGVRHVVDVTGPRGWHRLRYLLAEPASKPAARILARFLEALPDLPTTTRMFIELMVRMAPSVPVARSLARHARLRPSTLMSRFSRAGLPSPKTYVAAIRLLYAAEYFENEGLTVTDVAYRLECSSPQSFGRHLRAMLGITPGEFRRRFSFDTAVDRFVALLIEPYQANWRNFKPLEGGTRKRGRSGLRRLVRSPHPER